MATPESGTGPRPRPLQVIAPAPFGGAETAVLGLLGGLVRNGADVELAVLADRRSAPFVANADTIGAPVHVLDSAGRNYLRDVKALRRLITERGRNVVHTHGYRADMLGWWAGRAEQRPVVCTAHGFTGGSRRNRLNQWLGVQAMRRANAVIAVSPALGDALAARGVTRDRLHVMPNAWSAPGEPLGRLVARQELGLDAAAIVVGWVGRVSPEKGPDLALQAQPSFGATLALIGDGPARAGLEGAPGAGAQDVQWLGARPAVWSLLPAFDVLLLSSRTEGTPMVLLEAMHARVPIVATPVGGVPALLDDSTAWLTSDLSPAAIANAVRAALADPGEARRRAARARERLEQRYAVGPWVSYHLDLYSTLQAHGEK